MPLPAFRKTKWQPGEVSLPAFQTFFPYEIKSIFNLQIYIFSLKIRIFKLQICIFRLKIENFSYATYFSKQTSGILGKHPRHFPSKANAETQSG